MYKKKSKEAIMKANLSKTLGKMKSKVADSEEVWLDMFNEILPLVLDEDAELNKQREQISNASLLTDDALQAYESRWGHVRGL